MSTNAKFSSEVFFTGLYNSLYPTFIAKIGSEFPGLTMGQIQDLYQETMIDVNSNIVNGKVSDDTNWKGYVLTIGFRKAAQIARSFNEKCFDSYDVMLSDNSSEAAIRALDRMMMEETEEQKPFYMEEEAQEVFESVLQEMTEANRNLIKCFYVEKMKMADIASRLGYSNANTAKARKNQVMKQLNNRFAAALQERGYNLEEIRYKVRG